MVNLLNHYFDTVTRCIRADNGIVDKYIGDAVMAFWSPPFSLGDSHAAAACLAALAQQEAIKILQADLPNIIGLRRNAPNLLVRMGIATGEVVRSAPLFPNPSRSSAIRSTSPPGSKASTRCTERA